MPCRPNPGMQSRPAPELRQKEQIRVAKQRANLGRSCLCSSAMTPITLFLSDPVALPLACSPASAGPGVFTVLPLVVLASALLPSLTVACGDEFSSGQHREACLGAVHLLFPHPGGGPILFGGAAARWGTFNLKPVRHATPSPALPQHHRHPLCCRRALPG